jgi:hypothetical protein
LDVDPLIREFSEKTEANFQQDWQNSSLEDLLEKEND